MNIFPEPTDDQKSGGWKINFKFLSDIRKQVADISDMGDIPEESVEAVLTAATEHITNIISSLQYCQICGRILDSYGVDNNNIDGVIRKMLSVLRDIRNSGLLSCCCNENPCCGTCLSAMVDKVIKEAEAL
jgi:hypothetical protein